MIFDLPARTALGREDFLLAPSNRMAVAAVDGWRGWPSGKLVLTGAEGAGKTHLLHLWAEDSGAQVIDAGALKDADIAALCDDTTLIAVDDAETVAGRPDLEAALFHLHNMALQSGGRLLLSARRPPSRWPVSLPDLASRLQASATTTLEPPDDSLLAAVMVKLFADRQLAVAPSVITYLLPRIERSLAAAGHIVAALDALALSRSRPVTRALAAELLEHLAQGDLDLKGPEGT